MEKSSATIEKTTNENNEVSTEAGDEPLSPSSTATSVADATFEPTIDELVNDFDDEQTLEKEEALAASENNNPQDEIATLKEESEMPLEELLAKYNALPPLPLPLPMDEPPRKKVKKSHSEKKKQAKSVKETNKQQQQEVSPSEVVTKSPTVPMEMETETDQQKEELEQPPVNGEVTHDNNDAVEATRNEPDDVDMCEKENENVDTQNQEKLKVRRSHLFELYPEQNFDETIAAVQNQGVPLETLYSEDEEEDEIEEEEEIDPDFVKKTIMVGSAFQAVIPGLSQYGDILPYENEDKLVWEPSQVSENEVEDYLLKIREIKASVTDDESPNTGANEKNDAIDVDINVTSNAVKSSKQQTNEVQGPQQQQTTTDNKRIANAITADNEQSAVVKDNEQALHLLVQCGYDFKEALRRKRLNAVPLTGGTMSIWSEEECQKFEEGIQKYGKDFLKIRQHLVRTRTMRELVQFYYLWKKSERRDHNFANSDTVDHMDIYLNEGEDYSSSPASNAPATTATGTASCRKMNGVNQSNFSIMTGNHVGGTSPTKNNNSNIIGGNRKRTPIDANMSNANTSGNTKSLNTVLNSEHPTTTVPLQSTTPTPTPTK